MLKLADLLHVPQVDTDLPFHLSPDRRKVAFSWNKMGNWQVCALSLRAAKRRSNLKDAIRADFPEATLLSGGKGAQFAPRYSPSGEQLAYALDPDGSESYHILLHDLTNGSTTNLTPDFAYAQQPNFAFSPDGKSLAVLSDEHGQFALYLLFIETGEKKLLFDIQHPCWDVRWSPDGRLIGWVHAEGAVTSLMVQERDGTIRNYQAGTGVHSHPQFASNEEIICIFESPKYPPDLWKIDLYGGSWEPLMSYLASCGWTVLAPNYRGSTGYGKAWQNASRFDVGGVDARDCIGGADYLVREGLAAPHKIAVTGRSHGGYLTMTCMTMAPEKWAGGSAVVPFMNWFTSHQESREDLQHWNLQNMGDPEENYGNWYKHSPYFFLDRIRAPVQLICGGKDPRCPASDSMNTHNKLLRLGKEVELLFYENEGHSFHQLENVIDSEARRMQFLAKVVE